MSHCGQPMTTEGGRWVCTRCGAWYDPGVTPPATTAGGTR